MEQKKDLQEKIFNIITITALIVSLISVVGNYIVGFPFETNYKWFFVIGISIVALFNKSGRLSYILQLMYGFTIIFVLIPNGFLSSGASTNNSIAYVFIVMIGMSFLFKRRTRLIMNFLLILVTFILLLVEYFFPQMIVEQSEQMQFFDRLVQVPLTLVGSYLLLKSFADAYLEEKEKLDTYSKELKKANEKLEFLAKRDELTGAYNRRAFDLKLEEIIKEKEYQSQAIQLILFDIDHFKAINDTYGHSLGDQVICSVAQRVMALTPENSFVARWGGDEFTIIYFGSQEEVTQFVDHIKKEVRKIQIEQENLHITLSIGITSIMDKTDINEIFKRVDEALYQSKSESRDRYTFI